MLEELNEAEESPRSRIAQLTYENQNLKERLKVLTTESDKRLKEFEECRRELETKEKHIRRLWRKTNCSHAQTVHIFFIMCLLLLPIIYIYISILFSCSVSSKILAC